MGLLDRLERKLGRYAMPRVTTVLAIGQAFVWSIALNQPQFLEKLVLIPDLVMHGEPFRLVSFLFVPPSRSWLMLFGIYLFYIMGSGLEATWGDFRYNVYLLIAYLATLGVAWLNPENPAPATYIGGSVFLAFAFLYPEFTIMLSFILPVKVKWLALITWI